MSLVPLTKWDLSPSEITDGVDIISHSAVHELQFKVYNTNSPFKLSQWEPVQGLEDY